MQANDVKVELSQSSFIHTPWESYGRVGPLQSWVSELKTLCASPGLSSNDWRLSGRAVMISHPDADQHLEMVSKAAAEAGMHLIELTPDDFVDWVTKRYIPTDQCPALVFVPQGAWSAKYERTIDQPDQVQAFRKALPNYLAGIDPDTPLVFVTSGSSFAKLDSGLRCVGQFDRRFVVPKLTHQELGHLFLKELGHDVCDTSLTDHPTKVGRVIKIEFHERRRYRLIALSMQRLAHREHRKLSFDDLVYFSVFGGGETDNPQETDPVRLNRIAVHEVGHALVSILDSDGRNVPDYLGIVSNDEFQGNVTESFAYNQNLYGHYSFRDSCHKIRIALAGRVAESVILGAENASTFGARTDLVNASEWAKDLMGKCGFSATYGTSKPHDVNLAVFDDEPTPSEATRMEDQARVFLAEQYVIVENMIRDNAALFDAIKAALLEKRILTQSCLKKILAGTPADGSA